LRAAPRCIRAAAEIGGVALLIEQRTIAPRNAFVSGRQAPQIVMLSRINADGVFALH
jgi:hypothetical protein